MLASRTHVQPMKETVLTRSGQLHVLLRIVFDLFATPAIGRLAVPVTAAPSSMQTPVIAYHSPHWLDMPERCTLSTSNHRHSPGTRTGGIELTTTLRTIESRQRGKKLASGEGCASVRLLPTVPHK